MFTISLALAAPLGYQQPPDAIAQILDAQYPPSVTIAPDNRWLVERARPALRTLADLAEPEVKVAGLKLNPDTFGPSREYAYTGMRIGKLSKGATRDIEVPEGARIRNTQWNVTSDQLAWTHTTATGIELWVTDAATARSRRLVGPRLNAVTGSPCRWLDEVSLICKVRPEGLGDAPTESNIPRGPKIDENLGDTKPARTYTNLLDDAHDEALFEHYLQSEVLIVGLDGQTRTLHETALIGSVSPSPNGEWTLVRTYHRPWSYHVPLSRFPVKTVAISVADPEKRVTIADLPLADDVPLPFGSTRTGRRTIGWRSDAADTLYFVEALDGGDAGKEADERDRLSLLPAPFDGEPEPLWTTELRYGGVNWGNDETAIAQEWWYDTREERTWHLHPAGGEPELLWTRSYQDRYADPGSPMQVLGEHGAWVLKLVDGNAFYSAPGYGPKGRFPRLDRVDLTSGDKTTLWRASGAYLETLVDMTDDTGRTLITYRQSKTEPPNYTLRKGKGVKKITRFEDWAPQFAEVGKEVVTYEREDGLELSATVYTPPGWSKGDGPLPTIFWAYPREFKSKADAGQVSTTDKRFSRPYGSSHLMMLLEGYAVVDGPTMPIIGEGEEEPNDTYVAQLVSGAEAAVKMAVDRGIADPDKLIIGGHSYGAFTTANLLAHTDLFAAGIARSGAYNRSLTPFGFQSEQRSYWDVTDTYITMSPFTHAPKIDEPILLIHGANDPNPGTYPMQSERMFEALKGNGATVRWVELPLEEHGYRARESIGHVLWEMLRWSDTYTD